MKMEELLALLSDNSEATAFVTGLNTKASNADKLTEQIGLLEVKANEAITTRQSIKDKYNKGLSLLGLEEINEETIKSLKGGKGDEKSIAEIDNLKTLLQTATSDKETLTNDYESKLQNMALDNAIINAGVGANVANEAMLPIITNLIKSGAVYEDGNIVYKAENGSTVYDTNNTPMTIEAKMNALKTDANYSGLFKPDMQSGTGSQNNNSQNNSTSGKVTGTKAEEEAYIKQKFNL